MTQRVESGTQNTMARTEDGSVDSAQPLVSAVITTYNRPSYLQRAVRSVLEQTYDNIELIVVDDHSDTHASDVLSELDFTDLTDFQYVRHGQNRGANAARNTGIQLSSGEYIAFLDDDDRWAPKKIERQIDVFLNATENVGAVYTGLKKVTGNGVRETSPPAVEGDITKALLCNNVVGSLSVIMTKADLAEEVSLDERFPSWADLEWYVNLSRHADFRRIPEPLVIYESRSHNRLSADIEKKRAGYELFIEEFGPVAKEYGHLFDRKMRGWAAFRLGKAAYHRGYYDHARRYLTLSALRYPLEPRFFVFLFLSLGGRPLHRTIRFATQFE